MFSSPFSKVSLVLDIRCLKQVKARRREFGEIYQVYSKLKWFPGPSLGFPKYLIWLFVISLVSLSHPSPEDYRIIDVHRPWLKTTVEENSEIRFISK